MKRTFRLFSFAMLLVLLFTATGTPPSTAYAAYTAVNSTSQGWIKSSGFQIPGNPNYLAGYKGNNYRDYFVFDLTNVSGNIIGASLRINVAGFSSLDASETIEFYDVTTPASALMDGTGGVDAYTDLGSGTVYGNLTVTGADAYNVVDVPLNENGLAAINSALGGYFSVGGALVTYNDANEFVFGDSMQHTVRLVLVTDTNPPAITVPSDMNIEAQGPSGAVLEYNAYATDETGPTSPAVTCDPVSGTNFAVDAVVDVTCTAVDNAGNIGYGYFKAQVVDTTSPIVEVPSELSAYASGIQGAVVSFNTSAVDLVDGVLLPSCNWPSGSTFPIGNTLVTCTAVDAHGNVGGGNFRVTVMEDVTPPEFSLVIDNPYEADNASGATVAYNASFTDSESGMFNSSCTPASGSAFPVGTTTVNCTGTDNAGNTSAPSFDVIVQDTTAPVLHMPVDMFVGKNTPGGAVVNFEVTASDLVSSNPFVTCEPASGSIFPVGTTLVNCSAVDDYSNTASGSFNITVSEGLTATFLSIGKTDGTMKETRETSNVGSTPATTGATLDTGDAGNDAQVISFLHFDTSTLPDNAVITGASLRLRLYGYSGTSPFGILGDLQVDIASPFFGQELALKTSDFTAPAGAANVGIVDPTLLANNWMASILQPSAFTFVNKLGTTQFRLHFALDDNDNLRNNLVRFYSGNATNAALRPALIVEYYIP